MSTYEDRNQFPVFDGSQGMWMDWIKVLFDGEQLYGNCASTFVKGPRIAGMKQSILPNWIVQLPGLLEIWKTSL